MNQIGLFLEQEIGHMNTRGDEPTKLHFLDGGIKLAPRDMEGFQGIHVA